MANRTDLRRAILDQASRGDSTRHPAPQEPPPGDAGPGSGSAAQASRAGKASVTGYFAPEVRRQLRPLAADKDTTIHPNWREFVPKGATNRPRDLDKVSEEFHRNIDEVIKMVLRNDHTLAWSGGT